MSYETYQTRKRKAVLNYANEVASRAELVTLLEKIIDRVPLKVLVRDVEDILKVELVKK